MVKTCSRAYLVGTNNVIFSPEQYIKVVITMCSRNLAVYRCIVNFSTFCLSAPFKGK